MSGEVTPETLDARGTRTTPVVESCPMLGFVDAETRHYSRPTAMHRCFAGGTPSLVTAQEQRDLCLSGRTPPVRASATPRRRRHPAHRRRQSGRSEPTVPPLRAARSTPDVPAGVAARMTAASEMRMANQESADDVPTWIGQDSQAASSASPAAAARGPRTAVRPRRGVLLVVAGAVLGLLVLVAAVLFAMPSLRAGLTPKPSNAVAALTAVEPQPTVTRAPAIAVLPTPAPTSAPASTRTEATGPISTPPPRRRPRRVDSCPRFSRFRSRASR